MRNILKELVILSLIVAPNYSRANICDDLTSNLQFSEFDLSPDDLNNGRVTDAYAITSESVIEAYSRGIFPWDVTKDGQRGVWYSPPLRGILRLKDVDIPRSDRKILAKLRSPESSLKVTFDQDFLGVVRACAEMNRGAGTGTWISEKFISIWLELHQRGLAHSVEVWQGDQLVGGNYGTFINGVYSGESMFHLVDNAGKLALKALLERLEANGHEWIDTQMAIGLSKKWGAISVPRSQYLEMLPLAQRRGLGFY